MDVTSALQDAAQGGTALYPDNINGHPVAAGYKVIGDTVAAAVADLVPAAPRGLYALASGNEVYPVLVNDEGVWYFPSLTAIEQNGWPEGEIPMVDQRQLLRLPHNGTVDGVDPQRFGPACCQP